MKPKFKWYMVPIFMISVTACDPVVEETNSNNNAQAIKVVDESAANKPTENEASTRKQQTVYVTALDVDSDIGDAAAAHGVLNIKNGCLYMDDLLLVVSSPHITWTQAPFTISDINEFIFEIGDTVLVGGSQADYENMASFDSDWKNPPLATCKAEKIWLMNGINIPRADLL